MRVSSRDLIRHLPAFAVLAWWLLDLQVHWKSLVEFQHGWLVPPLAAFLVWERWPTLPPSQPEKSMRGPLLLAIGSVPLLLLAELYKNAVGISPASTFALSLGCVGFLISMLWLLHGFDVTRRLIFPVLFMFVAVPIPKVIWNPIILGLQTFITQLNVEALNLLGIPALRTGNLIQLPAGTVGVDEACSGIRSVQASIMAALFLADITFRRGSVKVFFLIAGVLLAIVGNFGRSFYLSITAANRGVGAIATVHDTAGWSVLGFTSLGLIALAWWMGRVERRTVKQVGARP